MAEVDLAGSRVLVTGGTGFLGRHVVEELRQRRCEVIAPTSAEYDLVDGDAVRRLLAAARADIVIHLAARVGGIGANRERPAEFFYLNLMMGTQLIHESWRSGVEKLVAIGTICAYPKHTTIPFKEEHLWDGYPEETNAPYGLAKKMLLVQSQAYRQQYGFRSIFLLPVNLYGPGDNFDPASAHVIPDMIRKFVEAKEKSIREVTLWGDGTPTREFLYVTDAARAVVMATERYDSPEPVNIGSHFEISIRDLAHTVAQATGFDGRIVWDTTKPNGQPRRKLDVSRAEAAFGFRAETPFSVGLRRMVDAYLASRVTTGASPP